MRGLLALVELILDNKFEMVQKLKETIFSI